MFVVTNRIKTKPGFAEKMAPNFTKPGPLQTMDGFVKVEVTVRRNITGCDELNVNMYWKTLEHYEAWRDSDIFREAHKNTRPAGAHDSPILESEIVIAEVVATLEGKSEN